MTFIPILTPGREDKLGCMQVPHDVFVYVTSTPGWYDEVEPDLPSSRKPLLDSIRYWMDENGACIIRSASSSKFAALQDVVWCATIPYSSPIIADDVELSGGGGPPPPPPQAFTISASPEAGGIPVTTTLTINRGNDGMINSFFINWGDGNTVSNVSGFDPIVHVYSVIGDYVISVQPRKTNGDNYLSPKTILITARAEQ